MVNGWWGNHVDSFYFFGGIMGVVRSIVKRMMMYLCVFGIERKDYKQR